MRNPKRKDKERVERARVHSAVSIAALAAGLASVTSSESCSKESGSMMTLALASATELLASHCIEMAEQAGADRECVLAATVRSSIDIHKPLLFSLHTKFQSCASCEHTHWYTLGFGYCMDVVLIPGSKTRPEWPITRRCSARCRSSAAIQLCSAKNSPRKTHLILCHFQVRKR